MKLFLTEDDVRSALEIAEERTNLFPVGGYMGEVATSPECVRVLTIALNEKLASAS